MTDIHATDIHANLGRRLVATTTAEQWLAAEAEAGAGARFAAVDKLLAVACTAALAGKAPVQVTGPSERRELVAKHLPAAARTTLAEVFDLDAQRATGAWWLPEVATVHPGTVNLPAYYLTDPRWAMNVAATLSGRVTVVGSPVALASWALLTPFADAVYAPLQLRGPRAGALEPDARDTAWGAVDTTYAALGLTGDAIAAAVARMRPGNGWTRLATAEQTAGKAALVDALRDAVDVDTVRRWRAEVLRPLVARYYAKAKKNAPTAKAVLTKALQPAVAGYFGGSWLALLDYLDEAPAAGDEITTALPEARLYVQGSAKVQQVAAEQNLPVEAVAKVLASLYGSDELRSPVERRLEVLHGYWDVVDTAHAQQTTGRPPLDDLASGTGFGFGDDREPFPRPAYERLLTADTLAMIDTLWGGECLPRYPDQIVSAVFPHGQMTAAIGPALSFCHGVVLTAWYFCEGTSSRTDIAGMSEYSTRAVTALADAGKPVDPQLFADLRAAQLRLGPPQQLSFDQREIAPGMFIGVGGGTRRDGFVILRDIVTAHRRAWAAQYLDQALRQAWETPVREVARQVNLAVARRGKLPTAKQFATFGATAVNGWFGGDLPALYAAVGEKAPADQQRVRLMPYDRSRLCTEVFTALGGRYVPNSHAAGDHDGNQLSWIVRRLAAEAPRFIQLEEALGRAPTEDEFKAARLTWPEGLTFDRYVTVVTDVRTALPTTRPQAEQQPTRPADADAGPGRAAIRGPVGTTTPASAAAPAPLSTRGQETATTRPLPPVPAAVPTEATGQRDKSSGSGQPQPLAAPPAPVAPAGASPRRPGLLSKLFGRQQPAASTSPELASPAAEAAPPAGWYADPHAPGQWRWWNGLAWTSDVRSR